MFKYQQVNHGFPQGFPIFLWLSPEGLTFQEQRQKQQGDHQDTPKGQEEAREAEEGWENVGKQLM